MVTVPDILEARRGHIEAPAGCGKTELIAGCVIGEFLKPTLILTHTTAGVAALRQRLRRGNVPPANYRLNTIAGWALSIIAMFPERAGYRHNPLAPPDYTAIQSSVGALCRSGNIAREIEATYGRLLVDEYQDCSISQHAIASGISNAIPTVVFGDPMQAVFGFGADPLADWNSDVVSAFPRIGNLGTPWRWNNAGANDLGNWLLGVRGLLQQKLSIDLRSCPGRVFWHPLGGDTAAAITEQIKVQYDISREHPNDSILIVGDSKLAETRHSYASRAYGVSVVEPVDFGDVVGSATSMNGRSGTSLLHACIGFLIKVMTNVYGDKLLARLQSIEASRNRTSPTPPEAAAIALIHNGGYAEAVAFMKAMAADGDRRVYRHSAFNIMVDALSSSAATRRDLGETIAALREQHRHAGRVIPTKAVGSTLLLKGLEAQHAIILDADRPGNVMSRQHLYVALSRGARSVHVFSRNPILP